MKDVNILQMCLYVAYYPSFEFKLSISESTMSTDFIIISKIEIIDYEFNIVVCKKSISFTY